MKKIIAILFSLAAFYHSAAITADVEVISAKATCEKTCQFSVTLRHVDTGWQHFANRWEVLDENGKVLATRVLHHPHVNEQPFTRSLANVVIPVTVKTVWIRPHDSQHGYGAKFAIDLPDRL